MGPQYPPQPPRGPLSGQKAGADPEHGQILSQTLAVVNCHSFQVELGYNTSGGACGRRGETNIRQLSTGVQANNPALLGLAEPWLDLSGA